MTKRVAVFGSAVMITLLAILVLWQFRMAVVYVLISVALAAALRPLVTRLVQPGLLLRVAWILLYLVALAALGFVFFQTGKTALQEIQELAHTLSARDAWMLPLWLQGSSFDQALLARLPPPSLLFDAITGEQGQLILPTILGFTQGIGTAVSGALIILFLSIYWSINQVHFERLWLSLFPSELRKHARGIWRTIETNLGAYIRSEVAQSLLAGLLLGLGYWLLGSPYPALLALLGAIAWLIPVMGAALAVIITLSVGLLTSVHLGLLTALYSLMVLIALQVWVEPRLFGRKWDNPILTLVIVLVMADAFGLLGILLAPPLSAACLILWNLLISNRLAPGAAAQVSDLQERLARLPAVIEEMDELPPPLVMSSLERLTLLVEQAEPILQAALPAEPSGPFLSTAPQPE
jgi:predicted PurR-regulated permease PerM